RREPKRGAEVSAPAERDLRARRRALRRKATYVLPLVLLLAFFGARAAFRRVVAERELRALTSELLAKTKLTGSVPASLAELGWRLPPIFGSDGPVDPWGHAFRYRVLPGGGFELTTLGPDGVPSKDDLVSGSRRAQ